LVEVIEQSVRSRLKEVKMVPAKSSGSPVKKKRSFPSLNKTS